MREISSALGASGSALFRIRRPGFAATTSISAAMFAAAVGWSTPAPRRARKTAGRRSSTRLTNTHSRGVFAPDAVDLGGAEDRDGLAAVEQDVLRRDLVRAVALARVVIAAPRGHRRLLLADRPVETRRGLRVGVAPGVVDVDRLARDHHRGDGAAQPAAGAASRPRPCNRCSRRAGRRRRPARRAAARNRRGRPPRTSLRHRRSPPACARGRDPVKSTCQPAASSRRAVARPIWPVPPMISARGIAANVAQRFSGRGEWLLTSEACKAGATRSSPPGPRACRRFNREGWKGSGRCRAAVLSFRRRRKLTAW